MTTRYSLDVPEQHYEAMLEHLLSLMKGRIESRSTPTNSVPSIEIASDAEAVQARDKRFEAAWPDLRGDHHRFFALLADRPGQVVRFKPDVANALGGDREAQNMTISLTPRLRRNGLNDWPIEVKRDEGGIYYKMDHELARVVRRLSDESSS
jgi:hypothetical protein